MSNLDRLEQINRLRASGVLTEDEYQREKAKALAPSRNNLIIVVAAIGAATAGIVGYSITQKEPGLGTSAQAANTTQNTPMTTADDDNRSASDARDNAVVKSYAWAASSDMIGKNPDFVKANLGPPETIDGARWSYTIDGCYIAYTVNGGRVEAVSASVTSKCRPVVLSQTVSASDTFGKYAGGYGFLAADCLSACGNAYDPPVYLVMPGYHANGFIDVVYSSQDYDPQVWADDIRQRAGISDDTIGSEGMFECVVNPPANVTRVLRNAKVVNVEMGYNLTDKAKWCGRG